MLTRNALKPVRSAVQPIRMTQTSATSNTAAAATTESPEGDLVNFPRPVRQEYPGKVAWASSPMNGSSFSTPRLELLDCTPLDWVWLPSCASKEIYIMEREFYMVCPLPSRLSTQ
ncbi:hypothetical protein DAPPUDRAFT_266299 [Daphnia pulex]|uniref:ATP synthase subunit b n=1 Tax=Daphnia pulex TaxID=6669 RepID=E9HUU2_DAPPU|nr:hypothetical protein DAPPUDRAFT_266299 [Daphnia pulex]|eukprot:EFX64491.1 hypothetical protein DAPPUDRAFT_266299 [Daphnia pulex]